MLYVGFFDFGLKLNCSDLDHSEVICFSISGDQFFISDNLGRAMLKLWERGLKMLAWCY